MIGKMVDRALGPPVETPMRRSSGNGGGWRRLAGLGLVLVLAAGAEFNGAGDALRSRANVATLRISAFSASIPDSKDELAGFGMKSIAP